MSNLQSFLDLIFIRTAAVAWLIVIGGCGARNERVLEYEAVKFIETDKGGDSFLCLVKDPAKSRVQVTRPDGERRKVREFDFEWVAAGAAKEEVSDRADYRDGVRRSGVGRKWIAAHFEDGVPSSVYLCAGAAVQADGSDNLKLPANEKQIRKAFGRPKKVYRRANSKPSFGAIGTGDEIKTVAVIEVPAGSPGCCATWVIPEASSSRPQAESECGEVASYDPPRAAVRFSWSQSPLARPG